MDEIAFKQAYGASRNGADCFYSHSLVRRFHYSNGVRECAKAGCYWLLDIAATELPEKLAYGDMGELKVDVNEGKGYLSMTLGDDAPAVWSRFINMTDLPDGEWIFFLVNEGERVAMILTTEY